MKLSRLKTILLFVLFSIFLTSCGGENRALDEFKQSQTAKQLNECVGASGSIDWTISRMEKPPNPDVRVIQAILTKGGSQFKVQWFYNLTTKVSDLAFIGKPGEKTGRLEGGLDLGLFCVQSGSTKEPS